MIKIRAIHIGDVRFDKCSVFELNNEGWFEMLEDRSYKYASSQVEEDSDWLIFSVDTKTSIVTPIDHHLI